MKAAGGVRDLDTLLKVRALGVTRAGATRTSAMLDECRPRLGLASHQTEQPAQSQRDTDIMIKLGFVTAILPELSLDEVLGFASAAGFDCVEVMCWPRGKAERRYAGVTHIDVTGFTKDDVARSPRTA